MEPVPLLPKPKILPNLDAACLLRELFQDEFEAVVPTQKTSENILKSYECEALDDENETLKNKEFLDFSANKKENVIEHTENVIKAYKVHENNLRDIREAEKNIFETQADFLKREMKSLEDESMRAYLALKRQPLFKSLDEKYVKKYKLLQGEAGLPLQHEFNTDFRVQNFKIWRKELETESQTNIIAKCLRKKTGLQRPCWSPSELYRRCRLIPEVKKSKKIKPKIKKAKKKTKSVLKAEPKIVIFTDYVLGDVYVAQITVRNTSSKGVKFQLKPLPVDSPFRVTFNKTSSSVLMPGLSLQLTVEFTPKSLDCMFEDINIVTEDGNRLLIPLIAYLEPPLLKTHVEIDELTNNISEKIASSFIECGACFTGDIKVTQLKFHCCQGSGEFFIMSSDNWNRNYINNITLDNLLEIPPFRVYPVFFKIKKNEVIDLFVEFAPKNSGLHVENLIIACDNGQMRSLDLLGDAVGWHSYYFTIQDSLLKELTVDKDDDMKVKYYIDFDQTNPNGKLEKLFCVSNNSNMAFEFQWKIREANIISTTEKYSKLSKYEVKIDPESGTFEPNSVWEFLVTIEFNNAEISKYRMVLSLYVLNLPYQCIEEDTTIIQPTGFVRNLYSQSLYGEEEASLISPELASIQGTYESLQESIKSYAEYQNKVSAIPRSDFCKVICIPNPGLCAKPLKKSRTFFNIGEGDGTNTGPGCVCRMKPPPPESISDSCASNTRDEKTDMSPQRNEIVWDFVDILVDEIELCAEVVPTRVTLEPSIIDLTVPLKVNHCSTHKKVTIINHNTCSVTCSWLIPSQFPLSKNNSKISPKNKSNPSSFFLLFKKKSDNKSQDGSKNQQITESSETKKSLSNSQQWGKITIKPNNSFTVPGLSKFTCDIGVLADHPGKIKETLCLNVNKGDVKLELLIAGSAVDDSFETSPDILDFGVMRQGVRLTKDFEILNDNSNPLFWKINQYTFEFEEDQFVNESNVKTNTNLKKTRGVLKGNSTMESYCLDARSPGLKVSLLEIEENNPEFEISKKKSILILGDVRKPKVALSTPRFENAILAPPGIMYVGMKFSTTITLKNIGPVETFITWGHSFGCHCRNIKVEISPKSCRIEKKQKLTVNIDLTPLNEGIISHCYIPCFFCRSSLPLILSIVAIAENLKVTFEIIDYPMQTHADPKTFLKSPFYHTVLRIPWPTKLFNPTLSLKCLNEEDILKMKCHCLEVEEEIARAFFEPKQETSPVTEITCSDNGVPSVEDSCKTSSQISKNSSTKGNKNTADEDLKLPESHLSPLCSVKSKKSEEGSIVAYSPYGCSVDSSQNKKFHLEFLCVPYQTPVLRQFVIRNETPLTTNFQITACTYGVSVNLPDRRFERIKNKVFGISDDFQSKLMKDQPLVIIVEPSKGELEPYDAICINVQCYGNTWGEYRDSLICQIRGIESFYLKMCIRIVGHPIYFPVFKTQTCEKPTLRFQPITLTDEPVVKQIKVGNRSCIPLTMTWMAFLTKPLPKEEEREESYNLCVESNINIESHHSGEESTESSKNYIPRNASESAPSFPNFPESKDLSENSENPKSFEKTEPTSLTPLSKKEQAASDDERPNNSVISSTGQKSDHGLSIILPGHFATRIFQVDPKEMSFEPFEQKNMTIIFDPQFYKTDTYPQEFIGVLAGCVKLKPEYELCPGVYCRPCGIQFVSEIMCFNAVVEIPVISFEILKGDLKFIVDANEVSKSASKKVTILRKFLIKNKSERAITMKIDISPGIIFKVKTVNTLDKYYPKYNPNVHNLKIEPGQVLEMELQCLVNYKDVMYAYEKLTIDRKKEICSTASNEEIWKQSQKNPGPSPTGRSPANNRNLLPKDSFEINLNRMTSKSDNSICNYDLDYRDNEEFEGEALTLPEPEEIPCKPQPFNHMTSTEEKISFIQCGLVTQSLLVSLQISFPAIRISPNCLDFGNVYLGESAVRYCSLINLTGFSTDFKIISLCNDDEFVACPLIGSLPASDYKADIGKTITIDFTPSKPGYFRKTFKIYCNLDMEFDFYELFVSGFGSWNEKYKRIKYETYTKLEGIYPNLSK